MTNPIHRRSTDMPYHVHDRWPRSPWPSRSAPRWPARPSPRRPRPRSTPAADPVDGRSAGHPHAERLLRSRPAPRGAALPVNLDHPGINSPNPAGSRALVISQLSSQGTHGSPTTVGSGTGEGPRSTDVIAVDVEHEALRARSLPCALLVRRAGDRPGRRPARGPRLRRGRRAARDCEHRPGRRRAVRRRPRPRRQDDRPHQILRHVPRSLGGRLASSSHRDAARV